MTKSGKVETLNAQRQILEEIRTTLAAANQRDAVSVVESKLESIRRELHLRNS